MTAMSFSAAFWYTVSSVLICGKQSRRGDQANEGESGSSKITEKLSNVLCLQHLNALNTVFHLNEQISGTGEIIKNVKCLHK